MVVGAKNSTKWVNATVKLRSDTHLGPLTIVELLQLYLEMQV